MRSRTRAIACAAAMAWLAGSTGCDRQAGSQPTRDAEVMAVEVVSPQMRDLVRTIRVTGTLFADEETTLSAEVPGRVAEILKDLGDPVAPGEPVLRLDPTDYALVRDEREKAFLQALARLGLTELPSPEFDVNGLPTVERARLQAENARSRYERGKTLMQRDPPVISEQDFADLRTAFEVAQSNQRVERLSAQAVLAEARTLAAQVRIAQERLDKTAHRAPLVRLMEPRMTADEHRWSEGDPSINGDQRSSAVPSEYAVAARFVNVGDYVQQGAALFRLVDADPLRLRAPVPQRRIGELRTGQPVRVNLEFMSDPFEGAVSRISPAVDERTRTFTVEILVSNPARALKPGSFATAEILASTEPALTVPATAVSTFAGVHKVFVVRENAAHEIRVELGDRGENWIEIRRGINPSDVVIDAPPRTLVSGTPVRAGSP